MKEFGKFYENISQLKEVERTGWVRREVKKPESVSSHSHGVAFLAMVFAEELGVNQNKVIKMGLIHDAGESKIGDIVTRGKGHDLPNLTEKVAAEKEAFESIFKLINGQEYIDLHKEFEEGITPEAKAVKDLDVLEMALQAYYYESTQGINMQDIFDDAQTRIDHPYLKEIFQNLLHERKELN